MASSVKGAASNTQAPQLEKSVSTDKKATTQNNSSCENSTMIKVGILALSVILLGASAGMYVVGINVMMTAGVGAVGGLLAAGSGGALIYDYFAKGEKKADEKGKTEKTETKENTEPKKAVEFTFDLTDKKGEIKITADDIARMNSEQPNATKVTVKLPELNEDEDLDDGLLIEAGFEMNESASSETVYIFEKQAK